MPADPEGVTDDAGLTLRLQDAIWAGDLERVVAALGDGADPNAMLFSTQTPLENGPPVL